jgi:hypothetical protein
VEIATPSAMARDDRGEDSTVWEIPTSLRSSGRPFGSDRHVAKPPRDDRRNSEAEQESIVETAGTRNSSRNFTVKMKWPGILEKVIQ